MKTLVDAAFHYRLEQEVVVYHAKPFTVKVLRVANDDNKITELISMLDLAPFLRKRTDETNGDANFKITPKNWSKISALLTMQLGQPRKDKLKSVWRTGQHRISMSPDGTFSISAR